MENFCWEWDVLQRMTAHVDTGEPLPRALFDKMLAAKNFQSGLQTLRQIEFALFDMRLHTEPGAAAATCRQVLDEVRAEVAVLHAAAVQPLRSTPSRTSSRGGYAAGYYSYKWAEVLSRRRLSGVRGDAARSIASRPDAATAQEILEAGGSRPAMESFKAFRGREPTHRRAAAAPGHGGMTAPGRPADGALRAGACRDPDPARTGATASREEPVGRAARR